MTYFFITIASLVLGLEFFLFLQEKAFILPGNNI